MDLVPSAAHAIAMGASANCAGSGLRLLVRLGAPGLRRPAEARTADEAPVRDARRRPGQQLTGLAQAPDERAADSTGVALR